MKVEIPVDVGAVVRAVRSGEREGRKTRVVVATRTYDTTLEDAWDAVTSPERIPRWFLPISGDLRVGGRFKLEGNAGGEILQCDPPRSFEVTWEFGSQLSWLAVKLSPESANKTILVLEHTVPVDDHFRKFGPGAVGVGWDLGLSGLGRYFPTKAEVDRAAAMAWMTSAEGKSFIRDSAADWCRADIAGGADEATARAVATATAAFYTGEPAP